MATQPISPILSLAELAAAQQQHEIFAHSLGDDIQRLARLRTIYARKYTELAGVLELHEETTPDLILRAADGRQLVVRLSAPETSNVISLVYTALSADLRSLEGQIVEHSRQAEQETHLRSLNPEEWDTHGLALRIPILALCAPNDPALTALYSREWVRRTTAAEACEEELQQQHGNEHAYGREILWHPLFPAEYVACISKLPLAEVAVMQQDLAGWCNQDRPLDRYDYNYLTDVLREALASQPTELAALRLRRALGCIEQASTLLLPTSWPAAAPGQPTLATAA